MVVEHKPDAILLDIMMETTVEGYGVTHSLKYRDEYAEFRHIPIFMISSIEESPDERFPMSAEVEMIRPDRYLTKPLDIPEFLRLLEKAVGATKGVDGLKARHLWPSEWHERTMSEPAAPEMVVVIDDDYAMRLSCGKILTKMGLRVRDLRRRGPRTRRRRRAAKPDMVVVDLKMPGISGMEVISRVHEIDPQIVIVVITGYATIDTAVQAMKCGAYDFLPKPFSPDELRLIVNRGLERRRLALESQRHEIERAMLKRRFVTFVSHQLRTPLVAIHQYLDVLKHLDRHGDTAARRQEWIGRCLTRIEELQNLIADWLTLAQVEGGTLSKERIKVDLSQIIPDILKTYQQTAAAENVPSKPACRRTACSCGATGTA